MLGLEQLILDLLEGLPLGLVDIEAGMHIVPTEVQVDLPVETRVGSHGELYACLPRGRFDAGYRAPLGRLTATCRRADEEGS